MHPCVCGNFSHYYCSKHDRHNITRPVVSEQRFNVTIGVHGDFGPSKISLESVMLDKVNEFISFYASELTSVSITTE